MHVVPRKAPIHIASLVAGVVSAASARADIVPFPADVAREHPDLTLAVCVVLACQAAVIVLLLRQRARLRRARRALEDSEARLHLAVESAGFGLWEWHVKADDIWLSHGFRTLLGLPDSAERMGREAFLDLVHVDDRATMRRAFASVTDKNPVLEVETRYQHADGTERILTSRGRGRFETATSPYFAVLIGASVDVTARRRIEAEQRRQRDELAHLARVATLGELTGTLAHEINQPLTAILSNTQAARRFLDQAQPDIAELRAILDDVVDDNRRAVEIIRKVRNLLKKAPPETREISLPPLVRDTVELLRADLARRGVSVQASFSHDLPHVQADPVQLQQILLNLLLNAADAMEQMPALERAAAVRVRRTPTGTVQITVEDRGPGIPPERLPLLFQPFNSTKPRGLGIGLSLCRTLAEAHQGRLTLANQANGRGAIATLELPAAESAVAAAATA